MLKLNKKGFGLATMIAFICVFIVFLLVVAFLIWNLNRNNNAINSDSLVDNNIIITIK